MSSGTHGPVKSFLMLVANANAAVQQAASGTNSSAGGLNVSQSRQLQFLGAQVTNNQLPGIISE